MKNIALIIMLLFCQPVIASEIINRECYKKAVLIEKQDMAFFSNEQDAMKWAKTVEGEMMKPSMSADGKLVFIVLYKYMVADNNLFDSACNHKGE